MNGFIKLHRKICDWEWYTDVNVCKLFIHLIIKANHSDRKWKGKPVKRGEIVTSAGSLASENGMTEMQVRTALKKLQKTGEITIKSTNKNTMIMVVNYDLYQNQQQTDTTYDNEQDNEQITIKQQSNNNQITTNKNDKNNKNEKKIRSIIAPSSSSSTPPVIQIPLNDGSLYDVEEHQAQEWKELFPAVDVMQELRKMKAWCDANPSKRKTKRGVKAFIVKWLMKEQDKGKPVQNHQSERKLPDWYENDDETYEQASEEEIAEFHRMLEAFDHV